jgi:hypothetical protein
MPGAQSTRGDHARNTGEHDGLSNQTGQDRARTAYQHGGQSHSASTYRAEENRTPPEEARWVEQRADNRGAGEDSDGHGHCLQSVARAVPGRECGRDGREGA